MTNQTASQTHIRANQQSQYVQAEARNIARANAVSTYTITTDLFGDCADCSYYDAQHMVSQWESNGWDYEVEENIDELRVYAHRNGSDDNTPGRYTDWRMVTSEYGYIVIGELNS